MDNKELGYIKLHRSFKNWEWYNDTNVKIVFLDLLLNACYKPTYWHGIYLEEGQLVISVGKLAEKLLLTRQQTKYALNKLKITNEITTIGTTKYTIVTIKNWGKYQMNNQQNNQILTKKQPTNEPNLNHNIRNKEIRNKEDIYCRAVIDYLNQVTGKAYRYSETSLKHIRARLNEGYTIEDCKTVIDKKVKEWKSDKRMNQYLRPQTLFNSEKFESYLNQEEVAKKLPQYMTQERVPVPLTDTEKQEFEMLYDNLK